MTSGILTIDSEIELRVWTDAHAPSLFALVDVNRAYLRQWLPWLDSNTEVAHTAGFIRLSKEQHEQNLGFNCGIWYQGTLCGAIGFHKIDWQNKNVEFGYWIDQHVQGKGIVTRASRAMVDYAFNELKLHRVQIRCATANPRSCAVIERLGLKFEGVQRGGEFLYDRWVDLNVYAIRDFEWKAMTDRRRERELAVKPK